MLTGGQVRAARAMAKWTRRELELGVTNPTRAATHFRAASNTKTMTASVIVQLIQEGRLNFNDPILKYVRDVPSEEVRTASFVLDDDVVSLGRGTGHLKMLHMAAAAGWPPP